MSNLLVLEKRSGRVFKAVLVGRGAMIMDVDSCRLYDILMRGEFEIVFDV